jgi:triosephosphate isomerase (TIM)
MTNKLVYFVGNWKMFGDLASFKIIKNVEKFYKRFTKHNKKNKIVFCIPNTLISFFTQNLKSRHIKIGAQDCHHYKDYGAFTGSVNASMLKNSGANYVIIGHSEKRLEGDTNKLIKKKIESALKKKLIVIFCIGETSNDKKRKKTFSVLKKQIRDSIDKKFNFKKIIIAYEPIWSIGTGNVPRSHDLHNIFKFIKKCFKSNYKVRSSPPVLYGGSVNDRNISMLSKISEINGFLIGGSSQSSKKFIDIIKNYYK